MKTNDTQYSATRITLEQLGLLNPRTFELIDGKFESAGGSRMEGRDLFWERNKNRIVFIPLH